MSMTKAEQKRVADLEEGLAMARAMRWPEYNLPASLTQTEIRSNLTDGGVKYGNPEQVCFGWFANSHTGQVTYGCSNGTSHAREGATTSTQGMGRMFNSKLDAWRTVRYEMTQRFSRELARVDAEIANCEVES